MGQLFYYVKVPKQRGQKAIIALTAVSYRTFVKQNGTQ